MTTGTKVDNVDSEGESIRSTRSMRSTRSARSDSSAFSKRRGIGEELEGEYRELTDKFCGAVFESSKWSDLRFVCMNQPKCARGGHKTSGRRGRIGFFYPNHVSHSGFMDVLMNEGLSSEEFSAMKEERTAETSLLMAEMGSKLSAEAGSDSEPNDRTESEDITQALAALKAKDQKRAKTSRNTTQVKKLSIKPPSPTSVTETPSSTPNHEANSEMQSLMLMMRQMQADLQEVKKNKPTASPRKGGRPKGTPSDRSEDGSSVDNSGEERTSHRQRKRASKRKSKKAQKKYRKQKDARKHEDPSDSSWSDKADFSDSSDSSSSDSSSSEVSNYYYAVFGGKGGSTQVYRDKGKAKRNKTSGGLYRRFHKRKEAWAWLNKLKLSSDKGRPAEPEGPPLTLVGKDPSTKNDAEVFGVKSKGSSMEIASRLSPPGLDNQVAENLSESLLDAVALPGKTVQNTEHEDTLTSISDAMVTIMGEKGFDRESSIRQDMKWHHASKNALHGIKTSADLHDHLEDLQDIQHTVMSRVVQNQRTILSKLGWKDETLTAWTTGGYYTILSRRTLELYMSLLQHLIRVENTHSWEITKLELTHHNKKLVNARAMGGSRVETMCDIYIYLRDLSDTSWSTPVLADKRVQQLVLQMQDVGPICGAARPGTPRGGGNPPLCKKCGTYLLHGDDPCFWSHLTMKRAKKAARIAMQRLGKGEALNLAELGADDEPE